MNKSLYVSGEFIQPNCGLGNYLQKLSSALVGIENNYELIIKSSDDFFENQTNVNLFNFTSLHHPILKSIKKIIPNQVKALRKAIYDYMTVKKVCGFWDAIPNSSLCLLPHIPLMPHFAPYYDAILKKKLVWVIHDLHPYYFPQAWSDESLSLCHKLLPKIAEKSEHIIVHNNFTRDSVVKHLNVSKSKMTIIPLPHILDVNISEKSIAKKDNTYNNILEKYNIRNTYALWASSSTFNHKNHERLISAWHKIVNEYGHNLQLVCTGSKEPNWPTIELLIKYYNLQSSIIFTGNIPQDDYKILLYNSKLAVCPTLFEGGGCGPAMEAAYSGIPVACSNIEQIKEQYGYRDDLCFFFDPLNEDSIASAVIQAIEDYKDARIRTRRALLFLETRADWNTVAQKYWDVIKHII